MTVLLRDWFERLVANGDAEQVASVGGLRRLITENAHQLHRGNRPNESGAARDFHDGSFGRANAPMNTRGQLNTLLDRSPAQPTTGRGSCPP